MFSDAGAVLDGTRDIGVTFFKMNVTHLLTGIGRRSLLIVPDLNVRAHFLC